jgi:hypothetical protein
MTNAPEPVKNRRLHLRRRPKGTTRVTCSRGGLGLGPNIASGLLDISETGVRLLVRGPVVLTKEVSVTLESPQYRKPLRLVGRAAWCLATVEGLYCVGIEFEKRLKYMDWQKLT